MAKNRVIYQTEAMYVGPTPATGGQQVTANGSPKTKQLHRIQSSNYGYNLSRRDVNQYGELAAIDRILLESPVVNLDFSYLNSTFYNEQNLGFFVNSGGANNQSCISYILNKTQDDKNYYIKTVREGVDAVGYSDRASDFPAADNFTNERSSIIFVGIGNGFISNFSTEGAIGDFPRTTVSVEALNMLVDSHYTGSLADAPGYDDFAPSAVTGTFCSGMAILSNPAVNPTDGTTLANSADAEVKYSVIPVTTSSPSSHYFIPFVGSVNSVDPYTISALRPGDITINILDAGTTTALQEAGALISDAKIQSYNLNFSLTRDPLQKLGSKYAFAREIRFPVQINLALEANLGDIQSGNLTDIVSNDRTYDVEVNISHPQTGAFKVMKYILKNAKLDSQSYTSSIGPNKAVSLNFSSQIGGPLQTTRGLFFSGYLPNLGS